MSCPTCRRQIHPDVERDAWGRCPLCVRAGRRLPCPVPREKPACETTWRAPMPRPEGLGSPFPPGFEGARMRLELDAFARGVPPPQVVVRGRPPPEPPTVEQAKREPSAKRKLVLAQLLALAFGGGAALDIPLEPPPPRR